MSFGTKFEDKKSVLMTESITDEKYLQTLPYPDRLYDFP
jgi:hypothetical protein